MLFAGAARVFATERDNLTGQYASEGLIGGQVSDTSGNSPVPVLKPAYHAFTLLAHATVESPAASGEPVPRPHRAHVRPAHGRPRDVTPRVRATWASVGPVPPLRPAR
jgi:hypothetical protein